jgi:uncharacterized protein
MGRGKIMGLDQRRISIFLAFSFGIAWVTGLVVFLTGGLAHSPEIAPGVTLAFILIASVYMWAPALANIFTRMITKEGWRASLLRPRIKSAWPYWLAAWVLPAVMTIAGAALFYLLYPQYFDPHLERLGTIIPAGTVSPWLFVLLQTLQAIIIAPLINSFFTFGEEFGWRGYLLPKLMPLGGRMAVLVSGVIWGVWHWPVIAMGHNYGLDYPGAPWLGMLAMVWFTFVAGIFLSWVTLRSASVWPAVIGHAAINGIAGIAFLPQAMGVEPNLLIGPYPTGLVGSVGFTLVALWILLRPRALDPMQLPSSQPPEEPAGLKHT